MSALAAASSSGSSSWVGTLIFAIPVLLLAFMFWSYIKRQRTFQKGQSSLEVGEEVSTTSGLYGTLVSLDDNHAILEAAEGVWLKFDRRAIVPSRTIAATRPDRRGNTSGSSASKDSASHTDTKA
ncbi:preprotein translocase subunit YajC [Leekyejoonella antrihumi]|uniref:Preprotein translocase subunit YajC n=1 Tax=Leekyejoonella antrihumi TaxID=1660198 RepID=A0A563E393_9MICO|nr:preprotein translocase subunit YajC [Leekyejoonella antrihumi]TWP36671.1 preprotein translocase subunit YajC [Leekyejoonella antrihumi]